MYVLMAAVAAYVVFIWLKSRLSVQGQGRHRGGDRLVVIIGMLPQVLDAKFWGVVLFGSSVMIMAALPWLDQSPVKSIRYRPDWHKYVYIGVRHLLRPWATSAYPAADRRPTAVAGVHAAVLQLLPADAVVERDGHVQAGAERVTFHPHYRRRRKGQP
jgi:ubiquinol-cytochrome c reductase cytochrome b subunit